MVALLVMVMARVAVNMVDKEARAVGLVKEVLALDLNSFSFGGGFSQQDGKYVL